MQNQKVLVSEIDTTNNLKSMTKTYQEVAIMGMQKTRSKVVKSRQFIEGLSTIFDNMNGYYKYEIKDVMKNLIVTNNKNAVVFISANKRFSGNIGHKLRDFFVKNYKNKEQSIIVIGEEGKVLLQNAGFAEFEYMEFPKDEAEVNAIGQKLIQYKSIDILFGKFLSIVNQSPSVLSIGLNEQADEIAKNDKNPNNNQKALEYLFEPSFENVVRFFVMQVPIYKFSQALYESRLSGFGSRVTSMFNASNKIEEKLEELDRELEKSKKDMQARKQMQRLAGMSLWKK